jgi:hypothetical protein
LEDKVDTRLSLSAYSQSKYEQVASRNTVNTRFSLLANKREHWKVPDGTSILLGMKRKQFQSPARFRALSVLARMRSRGESLSHAARIEHTTPRTVRRLVGSALIRDPRTGRIAARRGDTFRRDLNVLGFDGYMPVVVRSSKQAHLASEHLIAVGRFLRSGDTKWLKPFVGKRVGGVELLTDPDRLHEFAQADLVKLDTLYRENRGGRQEK